LLPPALVLALVAVAAASLVPRSLGAQGRERTLFVSALDEDDEPVEGLGPDAFIVREDGRRREVLRVSRATEPIDIALLVDNSTAATEEITFIRDALSTFVARMAPNNRIAIVALADRPTVFVEYTSDPERLAGGIGRLFGMPQSGMTLLDGLAETAQGLERRESPRAAIVPVITDGVEFTNHYATDVTARLERAGAALHLVTIGQFPHSEEHSLRERSLLLDLAPRATGGQRISLLAPHALTGALERLARELSSQYKVVYGVPDSLYGPDEREIASAREGVTMRGTAARGDAGATP
jgi:VWFA-related protein